MRIPFGLILLCLSAITGEGSTLFYNGAPDLSQNGNFLDCNPCSARTNYVFDNFTVGAGGWNVSGVFGNYLMTGTSLPLPTTGYWEILQGIGAGVSGTLVASGSGSLVTSAIGVPAGATPTWTYFQGSIAISSLFLPQGNYWMVLAPYGGSNETFVMGTFGSGGVGAIIDGTSFAQGTIFPTMINVGTYMKPFTGYSNYDWSYGVTGAPTTPEPATSGLLVMGMAALAGRRWWRRRA